MLALPALALLTLVLKYGCIFCAILRHMPQVRNCSVLAHNDAGSAGGAAAAYAELVLLPQAGFLELCAFYPAMGRQHASIQAP